jgi:hypothetical protein
VANGYGAGEIRNLVVAEVQNQLKPLIDTIDRHGKTLRSLYANGSGGPPGYLEMARAEDKDVQNRIFIKLDKVMDRLDAVEGFIDKHNTREDQREQDRKIEAESIALKLEESEKRSNRRITIWMLALAILMALFGLWDHKEAIAHSLLAPTTHSQLVPQNAGIPELRR